MEASVLFECRDCRKPATVIERGGTVDSRTVEVEECREASIMAGLSAACRTDAAGIENPDALARRNRSAESCDASADSPGRG